MNYLSAIWLLIAVFISPCSILAGPDDPDSPDQVSNASDSDDDSEDENDLVSAIISNSVNRARQILASHEYPQGLVNDEDELGLRPLYFVSSPEMLELLLGYGAFLREGQHVPGVHVDYLGRNPLHYLLSITANVLLDRAHFAQRDPIRRRIEATAYFLMGINAQDDVDGHQVRMELQEDLNGLIPADYLPGPGWRPEFVDRLRQRHQRQYVQMPPGGYAAMRQRQAEHLEQIRTERRIHPPEEQLRLDLEFAAILAELTQGLPEPVIAPGIQRAFDFGPGPTAQSPRYIGQ